MAATRAGGIVFRQRQGKNYFLIVRSKPNPSHWVIPKGHIEPGEGPEEAAVREILEETGVLAKIITPLGTLDFSFKGREISTILYLMEYFGETAPMEARDRRWGVYEEIFNLLTFEDTREFLSQAHELVIRKQTEHL